ncbi:unnamed protein product [Protopolystoma xenopodis]|uniref:Uncharacterized protein n=1 Tax=Protopolystoma xenopodis TaxID=117903 RepID=A0A3S5C465_9PLAT|nr:unnamed protein product [Protopolystoma xenopodis]
MGFEVFAVLLGSTMFGAITTPYRRATSCQSASFVSNLTTGSYLLSTDFRPSEMVEPNIDALNEVMF